MGPFRCDKDEYPERSARKRRGWLTLCDVPLDTPQNRQRKHASRWRAVGGEDSHSLSVCPPQFGLGGVQEGGGGWTPPSSYGVPPPHPSTDGCSGTS